MFNGSTNVALAANSRIDAVSIAFILCYKDFKKSDEHKAQRINLYA